MDMKPIPARKGNYNVKDYDALREHFDWDDVSKQFSMYESGKVNIAYEALERHAELPNVKHKRALIYASPHREETFTFLDMSKKSNRFANILKKYGAQKGDRIFLLLPETPEFYIAFFGILKIGAIAGPLFDEFMEEAIRARLQDSEATMLVTTSDLLGRVPYKELPHLKNIIVIGDNVKDDPFFIHYEEEMETSPDSFEMEWLDKEDGMLLHYTAGSTEKPKGVLHVHEAMIQHYATAEWVLDLQPDDIYFCNANRAWVAGTSYGIFAPWLHGVTTIILDDDQSPESYYEIMEKYEVSVWYTSPPVLRMLASLRDEHEKYNLSALRHIVSGGQQLNPEVITWGLETFDLRIHDTWLMTETGAHMIVNLPCNEIRPGSMGKPIPGVEAAIIDHEGNELSPYQMGNLAFKADWPAMMRAIWNNRNTYESYFLKGWFLTGDSAFRDEDGYFWFQGRLDDVINTSDERISPFEIESKLIEHPAVQEAGVIGKPDPEHGEIIKAFITLNSGFEESEELLEDIREFIKNTLSVHAAPDEIEVKDEIPKTRSGKIMRQLLKSWEQGSVNGDVPQLEV